MVNAEWLHLNWAQIKYLITRVAVIKEHVWPWQICGSTFQCYFPVQDEETAANSNRTTNLSSKQMQEICGHGKKPKNIMSTEKRRNVMNTYTKYVQKQIREQ